MVAEPAPPPSGLPPLSSSPPEEHAVSTRAVAASAATPVMRVRVSAMGYLSFGCWRHRSTSGVMGADECSALDGAEHHARDEVLLQERVEADDRQHGQQHRHRLDVGADLHGIGAGAAGDLLGPGRCGDEVAQVQDRKSTRLNSSHVAISYAVFGLKKKSWEAGAVAPAAGS